MCEYFVYIPEVLCNRIIFWPTYTSRSFETFASLHYGYVYTTTSDAAENASLQTWFVVKWSIKYFPNQEAMLCVHTQQHFNDL